MAFPTVAATALSSYATNDAGARSATLPAGISAGHLLVAIFAFSAERTFSDPSGWTRLSYASSSGTAALAVFYKIAAGSDANPSITPSGTTRSAHITFRITDHGAASTAPEVGTSATGSSTTPNPPSLAPSWGSEDTLWLALGAGMAGAVNSYPTSYSNGLSQAASTVVAMSAERQLAASSEDPSTFALNASGNWTAQTLAVRPLSSAITGTGSETAPATTIAAEGGVYRQSLSWVTIA